MRRGNRETAGREMPLERRAESGLGGHVERVQRLVEQPERRLRQDDPGQRGATTLAGRQGPHLPCGKTDQVQRDEGPFQPVPRLPTPQPFGEDEVLHHREVALQPLEMAEPGQPPPPGLGVEADVGALPGDRAGMRRRQPGQCAQQAGLAAAVAPGQRQELAFAQGEGKTVEYQPAAAAARQAGHFEKRRRHGAPS